MCFSGTVSKEKEKLAVAYISNIDDFIDHLFAIFDYLYIYPTFPDYEDQYDGHVITFGDLEVTFFAQNI